MELLWLALPGAMIWFVILLLPWQPWRIRERLEAIDKTASHLSDITVLIPARNEADCIAITLAAVAEQGHGHRIVLINDESTDGTVDAALQLGLDQLTIINSHPLGTGWTGKLWALQQGLAIVETETVLLLDADIQLLPGTIAALKQKMQQEDRQLVSLMAFLRMQTFWEKLLMPAFIYFFKLLYPFHLANSSHPLIAAAAGGCILLEKRVLDEIGGFTAIKEAIIDDCRLAREIKNAGYRTWIGLTHSAISLRPYDNLNTIWNMVSRTAFTQLQFSSILLTLCTLLMLCAFVFPALALLPFDKLLTTLGLASFFIMFISYLPTVNFYRINPVWVLALPVAGVLYLVMTWHSAYRYWRGVSASWKDRDYSATD